MIVIKLISLKNTVELLVSRGMSVSQQQQLGCLFHEVKFVIFIMFESRNKLCSKIEKACFLLVHWVAKNNSANENIQKKSSGGVLSKWILKNFAKFTGKHLHWSLFY